MDIVVGINGYNNWKRYTEPCIRSIHQYEQKANVVVVDNGSTPPYPVDNWARTVRVPNGSYSAVINTVVNLVEAEWYVILNNDTLCTAPFCKIVRNLDKNVNYGLSMKMDDIHHKKFIETWIIIFSKQSYEKIGPFDEKFLICGYEDADWGWRATEAGVDQQLLDKFPFKHLGGSRWDTEGYDAIRDLNKQYLIQKHGEVKNLVRWHETWDSSSGR